MNTFCRSAPRAVERRLDPSGDFKSHGISLYRNARAYVHRNVTIGLRPSFGSADPINTVEIPRPKKIVLLCLTKDIQGRIQSFYILLHCLVIRSIIPNLVLLINIAPPDRHILIARLTKAELHERIAINAVRVQMHPRYHAQASLPFLSPAFFNPYAWRKNRG